MGRIKDFFTGEAAKLREMNFTEKRQYLWEYYKLHLGVVLVLAFVVFGFLDAWVFNPPKDELLHIAWLADYEDDAKFAEVTDMLMADLVTDPEKETVMLTSFAPTNNPEYDMAKSQQFSALLGAGDLDVFMLNGWQAVTETLPGEIISPLDGTVKLLETTDPELYGRIAPSLREAEYVNEDGAEISGVYAIPLEGSPFINGLGLNSKELYMCVSVTTDKLPEIVRTLQLFFVSSPDE